MNTIALILALAFGAPQGGGEHDLPVTIAEASGFTRTSSHDDILRFLDRIQAAGASMRVETIGETTEGRRLVLAVLADPPVDAPPDPATRKKVVVCVQANIHGGEVDGKEAAQMLLRDIALGDMGGLLDNLIVLVIPDYNPDGNDKFGPTSRNRRSQPGPEIVGQRHNGQGLDLNRDYLKARSPEFRAVVTHVFNTWDPDIFIDMHTTNGSYHGYPLLFATPLHPGGATAPMRFAQDRFLPEVQHEVRRHGYEIFQYGNFDNQANPTRWSTYDYKGRMGWNYAGLRGRIGILSESYAYAPFRTRVEAGYHFVEEILRAASRHADEILSIHRETDAETLARGKDPASAPPVALRGTHARRPTDEMVLVEETADPPEGSRRRVRLGLIRGKILPIYDRFDPDREVPLPAGYILPPDMEDVVAHLRLHGIRVERLDAPYRGAVETWTPTAVTSRESRWERIRTHAVDAEREREDRVLPAASFVVPTSQRLGTLAVHLLEPEAPDSIVAWGLAGFDPKEGEPLPYFRLPDAVPGAGR